MAAFHLSVLMAATGCSLSQTQPSRSINKNSHELSNRHSDPNAPAPSLQPNATNPGVPLELPASAKRIADKTKMSPSQKARLKSQAFVVTPVKDTRFGKVPMTLYDEIYQQDLPVLITADSILYAFHRRYSRFLPHLEDAKLSPLLARVLLGARRELGQALRSGHLGPTDSATAQDLDIYLSVALGLLGYSKKPVLKSTPRARVSRIIRRVHQEKHAALHLFGQTQRDFDYSLFAPRGHYQHIERLERYFRTMMWLGKAPLPLTTIVSGQSHLHHEGFNAAMTLSWLIQQSGELKSYQALTQVLDSFVGPADDDSLSSMLSLFKQAGVQSIREINTLSPEQKQQWLAQNQDQRSRIISHTTTNSHGRPNQAVARHFMLVGQRYTLDSHVFQNLVYDRLFDPRNPNVAIKRMMPKTLDLLAALGNDHAKNHLKAEFRRFPYEAALDQERARLAGIPKATWTHNVHSAWLSAIASLHQNPDDPRLAPVFRSPAWKDKTLQTQLASWAELRHDHILYAKQSMTVRAGCEFPDAYVEPVPHFFANMKLLVSKLHAAIDALESVNIQVTPEIHQDLVHFSQVMDRLYTIADKELKQQPLSPEEKHFLKQAVESETSGYGPQRWDGWYPKLTGERRRPVYKPTIADVHTDPPGQHNGFKPRILHAATGYFELATIIVDCNDNQRCAYVGPVSSFYELTKQERFDNQHWKNLLYQNQDLDHYRPAWTSSFRVTE